MALIQMESQQEAIEALVVSVLCISVDWSLVR